MRARWLMLDEGKRDIKCLYVLQSASLIQQERQSPIWKSLKYMITKHFQILRPGLQEPHAIGNTLTETSMRCPPEPTITPSTGATSV